MESSKQLSGLTHELFRQVVEAEPTAMVMIDFAKFVDVVRTIKDFWFGVVTLPPVRS